MSLKKRRRSPQTSTAAAAGADYIQQRASVTQRPKLITLPLKIVADMRFALIDFMCFDKATVRRFFVDYPRLFTKEHAQVEANFIYLTQVIKLTHEQIAHYPPILCASLLLVKTRYALLKKLDKLQFDPTQAGFVSLKALVEPVNESFCKKTAKITLDEYDKFLKSI